VLVFIIKKLKNKKVGKRKWKEKNV
jgi:hypothetical protein